MYNTRLSFLQSGQTRSDPSFCGPLRVRRIQLAESHCRRVLRSTLEFSTKDRETTRVGMERCPARSRTAGELKLQFKLARCRRQAAHVTTCPGCRPSQYSVRRTPGQGTRRYGLPRFRLQQDVVVHWKSDLRTWQLLHKTTTALARIGLSGVQEKGPPEGGPPLLQVDRARLMVVSAQA